MLDKKFKLEDILFSENLAEELDEQSLSSIALDVIEGYTADKQSRAEWESRQEDYMKLAMQIVEEKTFPWKGAANVKYPLLTTASMQFSARAYPALVPGVMLVKGKVTGFDPQGVKTSKADRIGRHMSYQLLEEMTNWEEDMDRLCVSIPIMGTIFKKTYYDPSLGHNCSELVYPNDLVVDYWAKSLDTAQRISHRLYLTDNDIIERVRTGVYKDWGTLVSGEPDNNPTKDELHGVSRPQMDEFSPHEIIEQHTYLDLDGDGYREPYIVTVHLGQEKVMRIVARFDEDSVYDRDGEIYKIVPTQYFTKFGFIPNPDGSFYDIGFGQLLTPLNETINTLINQLLDSGSLATRAGGFISKGIRMKGGEHSFNPFEWKFVNSTGDDLRKGIFPLPVRDPSNVLFTLLGTIVESGEKMVAVTDMMLGQNPGQNQPATTSMAVIEQGLKVFTSIYKRLHRSLKEEYRKLFALNSKYLPEETYFRVLDEGQEQTDKIVKSDYDSASADVQPYADPNIASDTMKMIKAQALLELIPLGTLNPIEVTKRVLLAQDQPNIEGLIMQQQGPSPEQIAAEDEIKREWEKIEIEKKKLELEKIKITTQAELNLAKAKELGDSKEIKEAELYMEAIKLKLEGSKSEESSGGRSERTVRGVEE